MRVRGRGRRTGVAPTVRREPGLYPAVREWVRQRGRRHQVRKACDRLKPQDCVTTRRHRAECRKGGPCRPRRTDTVDEMIRKADELIAKQRRLITILELELGKRIEDRRPEPSEAQRAR